MATSLMRRSLFTTMDPTWSRMWDWFTTPAGLTPLSRLLGDNGSYIPPVDIYETRDEVVVAASLPGLDAEKVNIEVKDDMLTISGEQQSVLCFNEEENATLHLAGIPRYGRFQFSFRLPAPVDSGQAQAKYRDGVLCVRFLKAQSARAVRIPVQHDAVRAVEPARTPASIEGNGEGTAENSQS